MAIRIDVEADGKIVIMRPHATDKPVFMDFDDVERAMRMVKYFINQDLAKASGERFVPQLDRECQEFYQQFLIERGINGK
jgi:hypothetical protein